MLDIYCISIENKVMFPESCFSSIKFSLSLSLSLADVCVVMQNIHMCVFVIYHNFGPHVALARSMIMSWSAVGMEIDILFSYKIFYWYCFFPTKIHLCKPQYV